MERPSHPHKRLIKSVGRQLVRDHFGLPQTTLQSWIERGVPKKHLIRFAALAKGRGVEIPIEFFAPIIAPIDGKPLPAFHVGEIAA